MRWLAVTALLLAAAACTEEPDRREPTVISSPAAPTATPRPPSATPPPTATPPLLALVRAQVVRAVDGDTLDVNIDGQRFTIRIIGVDTPETVAPGRPVQCYGPEASARTKELVEGKTVFLEKDVSETDRFGRLLRYVYLEDGTTTLNELLVREGYAAIDTFPPDVKYSERFLAAQREAVANERGLWKACGAAPLIP